MVSQYLTWLMTKGWGLKHESNLERFTVTIIEMGARTRLQLMVMKD